MVCMAKGKDNILLYGTLLILLFGIVLLIAITFALAESFPLLFGQCVGVVTINQEITTESIPTSMFGGGIAGSEEIAEALLNLEEREDIAAVVIVINSPGGSVVATHEVYDAVKGISKPKVAYFREVAASGGYYIATPADYIISDPDAITGSIGVITALMEMSGLLEKVGVNATAITSGAHKDIGSSYREPTEQEIQILQELIDEVFQEFKDVVVENRGDKLDTALFNEVLDGRIVSGRQAVRIGLVDAVGTKQDAIYKAAELAGIPEDEVEICEISLVEEEMGLFDVRALIRQLETKQRTELRYE